MKISDIAPSTQKNIEAQFGREEFFLADKILVSAVVPSFVVYHFLKDRFGYPQLCDDRSKSQWRTYLRAPRAYLEVSDYDKTIWMVEVYEDSRDEQKAEEIGREFIALIEKQALHYSNKIKKASASGTFVLQNPYLPYYQSAANLLVKAQTEKVEMADYCRSAFFLLVASFEGLLNLIYELYLKRDLRDERILRRLTQEQIDIKLRLAPVYCDCFLSQAIDHDSDVFKKFHTIVNLRNDFVHANITQSMKNPVVIEDGFEFVLDRAVDKDFRGKNILSLTPTRVAFMKTAIDEMIEELLASMKPKFRNEFRKVMKNSYIRITVEDGEMIIEQP